jgi:hypothetical protein
MGRLAAYSPRPFSIGAGEHLRPPARSKLQQRPAN